MNQRCVNSTMRALRGLISSVALVMGLSSHAESPVPDFSQVPGVVIDHSPAASGIYIGSPSLAILPDGNYVASHDEFGPKSLEHKQATSHVFRSVDRGQSWRKISTIEGAFWSSLFVHRGALYLLGPNRHHGDVLLRRSLDGGVSWSQPTNAQTGQLTTNGQYHCAPMPVLEYRGRLWRGMEWRNPPVAWGINYRAGMLSVPVEADLLNAANWTFSNFVPSDRSWNNGDMGAWLEGNVVVSPDGELVDVLRVQPRSPDEKAAIVRISADGTQASFDPANGFIEFPGGAKKFAIRFDPKSQRYWSLASIVPERHRAPNPGGIRNTLALTSSPDLRQWTARCILLYHPDVAKHGFQYVDWLFEGEDLIAACRTAYEDGLGGAHNNHDANFLTFHRWKNFRELTLADSVPMPEASQARFEVQELILTGTGFELAKFEEGGKAYSNRDYVWHNTPEILRGGTFTRKAGGELARIKVTPRRQARLFLATALSQSDKIGEGWQPTETTFYYTDRGQTKMAVFARDVEEGEEVTIPQEGWTGGLLVISPKGGIRVAK